MIRRSPSSTEDTIQVAYSIIPDELEQTIIETRTDNSKALNSIKQLKKKISSDIEEKKKQ
jgi:hypothetical protein